MTAILGKKYMCVTSAHIEKKSHWLKIMPILSNFVAHAALLSWIIGNKGMDFMVQP